MRIATIPKNKEATESAVPATLRMKNPKKSQATGRGTGTVSTTLLTTSSTDIPFALISARGITRWLRIEGATAFTSSIPT
jgi:hypothetical protein